MDKYDLHLRNLVDEVSYEMEIVGVIKFFKGVAYGTDANEKVRYKEMLFLADPKTPDPEEWVKKAVMEFDFNREYEGVRSSIPAQGGTWDKVLKCIFVKTRRKMLQEKRKKGQAPEVSGDELAERVLANLSRRAE